MPRMGQPAAGSARPPAGLPRAVVLCQYEGVVADETQSVPSRQDGFQGVCDGAAEEIGDHDVGVHAAAGGDHHLGAAGGVD